MAWRVARIQLASRPEGRETVCPQPFQVPRNVVAMGWRAVFSGAQTLRGGKTSPQVGAGAPCAKGGVSYARRDIGQDPTNCYPSLLVRGRRLALCRPLVEASGLLNVSLLQGRLCAGGRVCAHGSSGLCSLKGSCGGAWQCWDCLRGDKPSPGGRRFFRPAVIRRQWLGCSKHGAGLGYRP